MEDNWWRDIPGYNGAYQINRSGEVRSWRWRGEHLSKDARILTQYTRKPRGKTRRNARQYVKLTDPSGRARDVAVIRIMVEVWFGGYPPGEGGLPQEWRYPGSQLWEYRLYRAQKAGTADRRQGSPTAGGKSE